MLVYRIAKKDEIEKILNKKYNELGKYFETNPKINTHNYIPNEKYLHFFSEKMSLLYLTHEDRYLCTYEIDDELLETYKGIGKYLDFYFYRDTKEVEEFAIPAKLISLENLVKIEHITRDIEAEEYIYEIEKNLTLKYQKS